MTERKLIYTIRFPEEPLPEFDKEFETLIKETERSLPETAEEFIQDFLDNTQYILNEEKESKKHEFLETVQLLAETYQIDTDIYEEEWGYVANLQMSVAMYSGFLKNLIIKTMILADCFDILSPIEKTCDVLFSFTYHTHDRYYKGEKKNYF